MRPSERGLEENFQTQSLSGGVSLLRAKSRGNVGTASVVGWPPDRPGRADAFCGLVANLGEKEMATHSSILTWRTPWTEEPGGLPSMGSHRVGRD